MSYLLFVFLCYKEILRYQNKSNILSTIEKRPRLVNGIRFKFQISETQRNAPKSLRFQFNTRHPLSPAGAITVGTCHRASRSIIEHGSLKSCFLIPSVILEARIWVILHLLLKSLISSSKPWFLYFALRLLLLLTWRLLLSGIISSIAESVILHTFRVCLLLSCLESKPCLKTGFLHPSSQNSCLPLSSGIHGCCRTHLVGNGSLHHTLGRKVTSTNKTFLTCFVSGHNYLPKKCLFPFERASRLNVR